jgi:excisionase family DNA binding protein
MSIASCRLGDDAGVCVSPRRAGRMLDIGLTQTYELMSSGELESFKLGKSRRITVSSIHGYVERRLAEARAAA